MAHCRISLCAVWLRANAAQGGEKGNTFDNRIIDTSVAIDDRPTHYSHREAVTINNAKLRYRQQFLHSPPGPQRGPAENRVNGYERTVFQKFTVGHLRPPDSSHPAPVIETAHERAQKHSHQHGQLSFFKHAEFGDWTPKFLVLTKHHSGSHETISTRCDFQDLAQGPLSARQVEVFDNDDVILLE